MKKNSALLAAMFAACMAAGCATRSWTEETDTWRATGPSKVAHERRGIADHWVEVKGPMEADGFAISERYRTDDRGRLSFSLLPAALQCLRYEREVELQITRLSDGKPEYALKLNEDDALAVVSEWQAQARLGAPIKLRPKEITILEDLRSTARDPDLAVALDAIRQAAVTREEWE